MYDLVGDHKPNAPSSFLLTFPKSGSQWVRDVLTYSALLTESGRQSGESGVDVLTSRWPNSAAGFVHGPIYFASVQQWVLHRQPGERAIVVLRDPRDVIVSWMYSVEYSHIKTGRIGELRPLTRALDVPGKILLSMAEFAASSFRPMQSWAQFAKDDTALVIRYEDLCANETQVFSDVFEFLGVTASDETLTRAIEANSFATRSGREKGESDPSSHFRSASPGDWFDHFDEHSSRTFETLFPGLLTDLGYETSSAWADDTGVEFPAYEEQDEQEDASTLRAMLTKAKEENLILQQVCEERLSLIEDLNKVIHG